MAICFTLWERWDVQSSHAFLWDNVRYLNFAIEMMLYSVWKFHIFIVSVINSQWKVSWEVEYIVSSSNRVCRWHELKILQKAWLLIVILWLQHESMFIVIQWLLLVIALRCREVTIHFLDFTAARCVWHGFYISFSAPHCVRYELVLTLKWSFLLLHEKWFLIKTLWSGELTTKTKRAWKISISFSHSSHDFTCYISQNYALLNLRHWQDLSPSVEQRLKCLNQDLSVKLWSKCIYDSRRWFFILKSLLSHFYIAGLKCFTNFEIHLLPHSSFGPPEACEKSSVEQKREPKSSWHHRSIFFAPSQKLRHQSSPYNT